MYFLVKQGWYVSLRKVCEPNEIIAFTKFDKNTDILICFSNIDTETNEMIVVIKSADFSFEIH